MHKTTDSITTANDDFSTTKYLLTYSEDEKQTNEINAANAALVFSPAHIQYYPTIKRKYQITHLETLLYGFITYYMHGSSGRFYFTNEQLAEVLDCSERTIKTSIKALSDKGLIQLSYRVKSGGGTIRFIKAAGKNCLEPGGKNCPSDGQNLPANKNKINKNNILSLNKDNGETPPTAGIKETFGDENVNQILLIFSELTGLSRPSDVRPRQWAHIMAKNKSIGVEGFRGCLKLLLARKLTITKLETVYRQYPLYERDHKPEKSMESYLDDPTLTPEQRRSIEGMEELNRKLREKMKKGDNP